MTPWACLVGGTLALGVLLELRHRWAEKRAQRARWQRHQANNPEEES